MLNVRRFSANPIISPDKKNSWEAVATFNGCPIISEEKTYLLYRAVSEKKKVDDEGHQTEETHVGGATTIGPQRGKKATTEICV